MTAGLAGEEVHEGPVQEPGDYRGEHHEPHAQPRHVRVRHVTEPGIVGVAGQREGEDLDQPAEPDRRTPGTGADAQGEHEQAHARGSECRVHPCEARLRRDEEGADGTGRGSGEGRSAQLHDCIMQQLH